MQAYGLQLYVGNPIYGKTVCAYWPKFSVDGKELTELPYKDSKSSDRQKGLFMRNRQPASTLSKVLPNQISLYSGKLLFPYIGEMHRYHIEGDFLWCESLRYHRRVLTVYRLKAIQVTDITSPDYGKWQILRGLYEYSDTTDVAKTEGECDNLMKSCYSKLRPAITTEPWMVVGTVEKLPLFEVYSYSYSEIPPIMADFINEYNWVGTFGSLSNRDRRAACQAAYAKAAEGIPQVTTNTYANVLEAASMLSSLLRRDFKKSKNLVGDAWLAYRYSYCTTISDVEEYQSYVQRIVDLTDIAAPPSYRCHGTFVDAEGWKYHCVMRIKTDDSLPDDFHKVMKDFGLQLTAVNVWDMIPYSFIVDWFLPVSDMLGRMENHWANQHLPILECWMSVTSPKGDQYMRFPYQWDNVLPAVAQKEVSNRTLWMRIADSIALLL